MMNLYAPQGRAGYGATTDGMWRYFYRECSPINQSITFALGQECGLIPMRHAMSVHFLIKLKTVSLRGRWDSHIFLASVSQPAHAQLPITLGPQSEWAAVLQKSTSWRPK